MVAADCPFAVKAFCDADWGGEIPSRRSTSGGAVSVLRCAVATWSRTQSAVALSSAEAEYYSLAVAVSEGRMVQNMLMEMESLEALPPLMALTDASAAKGAAERAGPLRMKHLELRQMFVKEMCEAGLLAIDKIRTEDNPVDCLTKTLCQTRLDRCLATTSCWQLRRSSQT
jgi:hypothetical protein